MSSSPSICACILINIWSFQQAFFEKTEEKEQQQNDRNDLITHKDEIFLAKPIMVEDDHSIESSNVSLLDAANVHEQEEVEVEVEYESTPNSSANPPASLSLSEDSDTARIYDLKTMETRFEKRPTTVSPDTVKFFAPKNVPSFGKASGDVISKEVSSCLNNNSPPILINPNPFPAIAAYAVTRGPMQCGLNQSPRYRGRCPSCAAIR